MGLRLQERLQGLLRLGLRLERLRLQVLLLRLRLNSLSRLAMAARLVLWLKLRAGLVPPTGQALRHWVLVVRLGRQRLALLLRVPPG